MLLVPGQVRLAMLFQPEVEGTSLTTIEALGRVHIWISAVPLSQEYSICRVSLHIMKPKTLILTKAI